MGAIAGTWWPLSQRKTAKHGSEPLLAVDRFFSASMISGLAAVCCLQQWQLYDLIFDNLVVTSFVVLLNNF
jgi:hypothetical protein